MIMVLVADAHLSTCRYYGLLSTLGLYLSFDFFPVSRYVFRFNFDVSASVVLALPLWWTVGVFLLLVCLSYYSKATLTSLEL